MSSKARPLVRTGALATALLLSACEGSGGPVGPTVELVDPAGENAAAGVVSGVLRVAVVQNGRPVACGEGCETPIDNERFELTLPLRTLEARTTVQAFIDETPNGPIAGATPPFEPFGEGLTTLRVVMAPPSGCAPLALPGLESDGRPRLTRPRRDLAVAVRRNIVLLLGGVEGDGPSGRVGRFDQAAVETLPSLEDTAPAGAARGLSLSENDSVFVADGGFWRFALNEGADPSAPILRERFALHDGASGASALVAFDGGAAVLGGERTAGITWLDERGVPRPEPGGRLAAPRRDAAAAALRGGVLVVGGAAAGDPVAEWLTPGEDGVPLPDLAVPRGRGGWLVPSPSGEAALWVGWTTPEGAPGAEAYLIGGCPDACAVERVVEWARPRAEAAGARTAAGELWIVGGRGEDGEPVGWTDVVRWGDGLRIEAGPPLSTPRAGAVAFEHAAGIVTVAGGEGPAGLRDDFEHCTPGALDDP
jgi:hypothetical protein